MKENYSRIKIHYSCTSLTKMDYKLGLYNYKNTSQPEAHPQSSVKSSFFLDPAVIAFYGAKEHYMCMCAHLLYP